MYFEFFDIMHAMYDKIYWRRREEEEKEDMTTLTHTVLIYFFSFLAIEMITV